jgi:hypothetical protein
VRKFRPSHWRRIELPRARFSVAPRSEPPRRETLPAATFYDVGDTWTEATPTFTQVTATLKNLGGDADVDNFLQATYADPNDVKAEVQACTTRPSRTG